MISNKYTRKVGNAISSGKSEREIDHKIKEFKKKLDSMDSPEQREQYILGMIHGHDWFVETLQRGLNMGLSDANLKKFLLSEIQSQKIYWRSVRDRI